MQININTDLNLTNTYYINSRRTYSKNMSSPIGVAQNNPVFTSNVVVTKTVSSKIASEKAKFLRHFKEILATNVPAKTEEEILMSMLTRAHNLIDKLEKRKLEISDELEAILNRKSMSPQQKYDAGKKLYNELNRINKINPFEKPKEKPKAHHENYDYILINKFKNAIMEDNYDLAQIFSEHYSGLETIQTVEELKEKYPSIKIPKNPKDVVAQKIIDIIPRKFYEQLDELLNVDDSDFITNTLANFFERFFTKLLPVFEMEDAQELFNLIGKQVAEKSIKIYHQLIEKGTMTSIPEIRKSYEPAISELDKKLLHIDYDKLVLSVLREQYLEGKKLNEITYKEGDTTIDISSLKTPEYKFEKLSEKIKKFITDSEKIKLAQRDYQKFTQDELKNRLNHYLNTDIANNENLFDIFVDFDSCKFTEEDKQYLIKFLHKLDEISDGKISTEEGLDFIIKNNIKPHGTVKLNEIERKNIEERIKIEKQKAHSLNTLKKDFNDTINKLLEYNLNDLAEDFMEYYPEIYDEKTIAHANQIIEIVKNNIKLNDSNKIKTAILRWKIYNEYSNKPSQKELFDEALEYGNTFEPSEVKQRCGQFLLNRELVDNYPASKELFPNKEIAKRIIEKFKNDINLATLYLCKYENYRELSPENQQFLFKILENFDYKNPNDKVLLKSIIESDYVTNETQTHNEYLNKKIVIAPSAKQEILDKYKFPGCIDLFLAFEEAMSLSATKQGTPGVKKIEGAGKAGTHLIELKIMGYPDRLFSDKNNYIFDIYSEKGLH